MIVDQSFSAADVIPLDVPVAAARYVGALTGDLLFGAVTWQTFDDRPGARVELARILHGTLADCVSDLRALNGAGAGIYVAVNETDLRGRRATNVVRVRALFVDIDGAAGPARPWHLPPSIVVLSAGGPHAYWRVRDCALADFRAGQQRLAAHYRSDPRVHDLPRVLRVPGFLHRKRSPIVVRLLSAPGHVYSVAEVLAGVAVPAPVVRHVRAVGTCGPVHGDWRSVDPLAAFAAAGLLGRELEPGKYAVICPWDHEHTSPRGAREADTGSVLWAPSGVDPGVYHCSHAHCGGRWLAHALWEMGAVEPRRATAAVPP